MTSKKWAQKVKLDEGSLKAIGWPNATKIIANVKNGKVTYRKAVQKLNYLANVSKDQTTVRRAKAIMVRLKKQFGK